MTARPAMPMQFGNNTALTLLKSKATFSKNKIFTKGKKLKLKIVLKKTKNRIQKIKVTRTWQKMFEHKIDEEKMREYQNQHRMMNLNMRSF